MYLSCVCLVQTLDDDVNFLSIGGDFAGGGGGGGHSLAIQSMIWSVQHGVVLGVYEPMGSFVKIFMVDGDPATAFFVNFSLHLAGCSLVGVLAAQCLQKRAELTSDAPHDQAHPSSSPVLACSCATAIVATHPICVEAVAWSSCQPILLGMFFSVLAMHLQFQRSAWPWPCSWLPQPAAWMLLCAVLSKATTITTGVFLIMLDVEVFDLSGKSGGRTPQARFAVYLKGFKRHVALILVVLLAGYLALSASNTDPDPGRRRIALEEVLIDAVLAPWFYIKLFFVNPLLAESDDDSVHVYGGRHLRPLTAAPPLSLVAQPVLVAKVLLALLSHIVAALGFFRVGGLGAGESVLHVGVRWASFWWSGYFVLLCPTLGLVGDHATDLFAADRYFYLPAVLCFIPGLAFFFHRSLLRVRQAAGALGHSAAVALLAALIATVATRTYSYAPVWDSDATLYPHLLRCNPNDLLARNNLAAWFARRGQHAEAVHSYDELLDIYPGHPKAPLYRAVSLSQMGEPALTEVSKTGPFEPFVYKHEHFTKTGSGQT